MVNTFGKASLHPVDGTPVGTIALYDGAGERLETIYLGQAPQVGKAEFLGRLDEEWQRVCKACPQARRVALSDGARDYEPWLAARTTWQILDFYHASGCLAGAAPGIKRHKAGRVEWLEGACHALSMSPAQRSVWPMNSPPKRRQDLARVARRRHWQRPAATLPITSSA